MEKIPPSSRTGIVHHGTNVALTPSRALTSHLRRRYHEKYRGRYRFAWLVFMFDTALLAIALGLMVLNVVLYSSSLSSSSGLELAFNAPELVAAEPVPVEIILKNKDGKRHEHVELTWRLPPEVEVVRAEPPLRADNGLLFGTIDPGQDARSRVYLVIRALPGTVIPFQFQVREGGERSGSLLGEEERLVTASALTAEPAVPDTVMDAVPGASLPIVVWNHGSQAAPAVVIRLLEKQNATGSRLGTHDEIRLGDLSPQEKRLVWIDIGPDAHDLVELTWEVSDGAYPVSRREITLSMVSEPTHVSIQEPLLSVPRAAATQVRYVDSPGAKLWVYHPLQVTTSGDAARVYDMGPGTGEIHIPLNPDKRTQETVWSVIPLETQDGHLVLGRRLVGSLLTAFPFQAATRYYTTNGDQIGIGSLPPKVGETTSYWVVWSIGPTDADLKDLALRTSLPAGVRATGKFASVIPGQFSVNGSEVTWTVPSLPVTGDAPATFAFEIAFTPTRAERGTVPILVLESAATAVEVRSGVQIQASAAAQDANLEFDAQARGKGKVE